MWKYKVYLDETGEVIKVKRPGGAKPDEEIEATDGDPTLHPGSKTYYFGKGLFYSGNAKPVGKRYRCDGAPLAESQTVAEPPARARGRPRRDRAEAD